MTTTTALAQAAPGADYFFSLLPFILIFAIMYFLIIRPQQTRLKQHREMVEGVRRGDTIVTGGGLLGKVARVDESEVQVEIAEGVKVKVVKSTIAEVRTRGEAAPAKAKAT